MSVDTIARGLALAAAARSSTAHPGYVPGNWYQLVDGAVVGAGTAPAANNLRLLPFVLSKPITVQALGVRVTTLGSGNCQLAIYAHDAATGRPTGSALVHTGSISTSATGAVSGAVTANDTLPPGVYWMAINPDNSTAAYQTITTTVAHASFLIGSATLANVSSGPTATGLLSLTVSQTFGTWPDLTSASFIETTAGLSALIFAQAA